MRCAVQKLGEMPPEAGPPVRLALMRAPEAGGVVCVRLTGDHRLSVARQVVEEDLLGDSTSKVTSTVIEEDFPGRITALVMDREGQTLYAGTDNGRILVWKVDSEGDAPRAEIVPAFHDKRAITSLAMVLGDVSLAVGDAQGGVSTWFAISREGRRQLTLAHTLASHDGPVLEILPSQRNKSLLSLGREGSLHLDYPTSERHLLSIDAGSKTSPALVGYSTRGNAAVALNEDGKLVAWQIDSPYAEVSWTTLFGKVLYEGYSEPVYAWQTTGGSDFEPKFSLVPILFGTLKGTFYAMLLAVPLALLGAAYTSQFTTPGFKAVVKPVVETMAAIPSVVIGFLVALWLAPIVDRWILAVFASLATIPLVFVAFMGLWQIVRRFDWAKRVEGGYEFLAVVPVLLAGVGLAVLLMPVLESWLFDGNFKQWLYEAMHTRFDQRNSIVIAFGLGLAVIPIIFSIAEDSLSTVPHSLTAASMALGASRWQTLWRVILPSGSPGIFAGTMIGFGRAVGETMIVLMATGNTPILDWSPLNGMRTLSANIAVEIPEAPVGGTLYRVLFLCAVLLFVLTFILNTAAELVRQRLRKRYGRL
jgi:phosphate transport system permease protein